MYAYCCLSLYYEYESDRGFTQLSYIFSLANSCGQERGVAEDIQHILAGGYQNGFALANTDAIDVGLAPKTHNNDERVAVEVDLRSHLYHNTMDDEVGTVDQL